MSSVLIGLVRLHVACLFILTADSVVQLRVVKAEATGVFTRLGRNVHHNNFFPLDYCQPEDNDRGKRQVRSS